MSKKARRRPKWKKPIQLRPWKHRPRYLVGLKLPYHKYWNMDFYQWFDKLAAEQEPLGEEFEKVLEDNLWNLYED